MRNRRNKMTDGRFGVHGGQYIPETLMNAVLELEEAYLKYKDDPEFNKELEELLNEYAGTSVTAVLRGAHDGGPGRCQGVSETRGSQSHRVSQNQQRTGAGASGQRRWARRELSQRPEQDSTAWRQRQRRLSWEWSAKSSWVRRIRSVRL